MSIDAQNPIIGLKGHLKRTFVLSVPMVAAQVLSMAIGVTDAVMVGRLGEMPLAQITLATQLIFLAYLLVIGFGIALSVIVATAMASDDERTIRRAMRMAFWQSLIFFVILYPIIANADVIFTYLGQDPRVIIGAKGYLNISVWALLMMFIANVFRNYLVALEKNNILMVISILGFLANIIGNYILIFGKFGFPELGLLGSAWATLITNFVMLLAVMIFAWNDPLSRRIGLMDRIFIMDWSMFWRLLALGAPASFGLVSEVSLFQFATIMMGWIGVSQLAAHGVVLQIASLTFMIPLGISIVASVRASNAMGRRDYQGLIGVTKASMILIMGVMTFTAICFWSFPDFFIGLFLDVDRSDAQSVMSYGVGFLVIAGLFQLGDGAQVAAISILRGIQDMTIPAILAFISYWCVGVPAAYVLAFHFGLAGQGIWMGLAIGLTVAAILLWIRFAVKIRSIRREF